MNVLRRSSRYSVDYIIKAFFILLLPVVILDIVISIFVIYSMRSQTVQSLQNATSLYVSQIDTAHVSINKYLLRRLTENADFKTVLETTDPLELIVSYNTVQKDVDTFMESFEKGYHIFTYNKKLNRLLRFTEIMPTLEKEELDEVIHALISYMNMPDKSSSYPDSWEIMTLDSGVYFFKIFHTGDNYVGCFISAADIILPLKNINLGTDGFVALTSRDGTALTNTDKLEKCGISFPEGETALASHAHTKGSYLIINGGLTMGTFYPQIILKKISIYEKIIVIPFVLAGAIMLIAVILFSAMIYMKKRVLNPIKVFSENLSRFDDSTEIMDLKNTQLIELEQANLQFKNLMRQIKKLKIDIYEKELEKQKTLMNYLQLQIRPHFFLNCLNTIYSMAQTQLFDEIMEMSMITSDYFRYIFQNSQNFVTVGSELKHIENYMKIQKLRYGDGFTYEIFFEEGTDKIKILPILIQTFIENAIKHSAALDEPITIRTDVAWAFSNGNPHGSIQIQITDTGNGFPEDVLQQLNSVQMLEPVDGHRIGITNAIKRLQIFYKEDEAGITFSNLPEKGACVTILLPAYYYSDTLKEV